METVYRDDLAPARSSVLMAQIREKRIVPLLQFGGQAQAYWDELAQAWQESLRVRDIVIAVQTALTEQLQHPDAIAAAVCPHGLFLQQWIEEPDTRPAAHYFSSSVVSQPLIFLTQIANVLRLVDGPGDAQALLDCAAGFLGHSQGVMTALCCAEQRSRSTFQKRVVEIATYLFWQGVRMQQAFPVVAIPDDAAQLSRDAGEGTPSPMAALTGFSVAEAEMMLAQANAVLSPHEQIALALVNGWNRVVVSGPPAALCALRAQIAVVMTAWAKDPIRRRTVSWEFIPVSAPFHSPYMQAGLAAFRRDIARLGIVFDAKKIRVPIFHTETGENLQGVRDVQAALLAMQWTQPVRWPTVTRKATQLTGCTHLIDFGPGDPSAKLTALNRRGEGIAIIAAATESGRHLLFTDDASKIPWGDDWRKYRPKVVRTSPVAGRRGPVTATSSELTAVTGDRRLVPGDVVAVTGDRRPATGDAVESILDNAFTRFTKFPPIFGAGMTPTSAETEIVAAAANAGYLQEWAGGGQVTEEIWNERLAELRTQLQPGRGVIFNALYLDPYLWKLHFPKICAQKDAGFPYLGLTISAGIPDVETATQILQELHRHHIWMNAFKPGNDAQIEQVLKIADANPEFTLLVHVEGGKAGGHHSWEDVQGLLRRNYARLRQRNNLIVCVGGGIATPAQAASWLWGDWHGDPELPAMPVDAVFLGTRLMACAEAKTSPQVKNLLAKISGTNDWVRPYRVEGGVTSQKSPLDADVYFADNAAARAGALLDRLAGKSLADIQSHAAEIIEALAKTCKPYFGDLTRMTYLQVLERMIELMAPGDIAAHLPHDGVWYDRSFRDRAQMWAERAMARCSVMRDEGRSFASLTGTKDEKTLTAASSLVPANVVSDRPSSFVACLDDPPAYVRQLLAQHPDLATLRLHPEDVEYFLFLCRQPGKPVNFVPVIDENVRRWFKADSLWQSHDPRYSADAVFTIPGPEAVTGITRVDEPIAEIFAEFEVAVRGRCAGVLMCRSADETTDTSGALASAHRHIGTSAQIAFRGDSIPAVPMEPSTAHVERATRGARTTFVVKARAEIIPDAAQWQQWCGAQGGGALAAFLRAGAFAMGQRFIPNLAQQLLIPNAVETWQLERQGDTLSRLTTAWCDIVVTDDAEIHWTIRHALAGSPDVAELVLTYRWCPDVGHAPIQGDPIAYRNALTKFYEKIWPTTKKNSALQIGATYRAKSTITRAAIQAYVAATGETAPACTLGVPRDARHATRDAVLQAPPIMSMVAAWEPFAALLMSCGGVANLLDLVHAAHGFTWCADTPIVEGDTLTSELVVTNITPETSGLSVAVAGHVARGKTILVKLTSTLFIRGAQLQSPVAGRQGPVTATSSELTAVTGDRRLVPGDVVAVAGDAVVFNATIIAPQSSAPYACASGDQNPIHTNLQCAQLAGLPSPIVHGMWIAAAIARECAHGLASDNPQRVRSLATQFLQPVLHGESIELEGRLVAMVAGDRIVELTGRTARGVVCTARARIAAPRTAYLFTGQGSQTPGMGMAAYERSSAARAVWDRADVWSRSQHGFSILHVVRDNPRTLRVREKNGAMNIVRHAEGVLHLTQMTQAALTVVAMAAVAELENEGCFVPGARFAGHSLGEYAALGAEGIVPFEEVLSMVYYRGLTMQQYIPRDSDGRSPYRMVVVRPYRAGLTEKSLQALIDEVRANGRKTLEIVNLNIDAEQYAVTGHTTLLSQLEEKLVTLTQARGVEKPALTWLPGIDVPFHSSVLQDGVADFRRTLAKALPSEIDAAQLVDRYIPNLNARPFAIDRRYVRAVSDQTASPILKAVLAKPATSKDWQPNRIARTLLIELLAYQFASPVQWIETQRVLLNDPAGAVEQCIEIGSQPVLTNMLRRTLMRTGLRTSVPHILHAEVDRSPVSGRQEPVTATAISEPSLDTAVAGDRRPATGDSVALPDEPLQLRDALWNLLALKLKMRPDEIREDDTIEQLTGGNSARRNEVLSDLGAEFNCGAIDEAHSKPLSELLTVLGKKVRYTAPGAYLRVATDQAIKMWLPLSRAQILQHCTAERGVPEARVLAVMNLLPLAVRSGDSIKSGALSPIALTVRLADERAARAWIDQLVDWYATQKQLTIPKRETRDARRETVDSGALAALEAKYFGNEGAITRVAAELMQAAGADPYTVVLDEDAALLEATRDLALYRGALGPRFEQVATSCFSVERVVHLSSVWNWARRDVVEWYWRMRADAKNIWSDAERTRLAAACDEVALTTAHYFCERAKKGKETAIHVAFTQLVRDIERAQQHPPVYQPSQWSPLVQQLVRATSDLKPVASALTDVARRGLSLCGQTIVVTGAGPDSIAADIVLNVLRAGATVIVTSSSLSPERVRWWRDRYAAHAVRGAELVLMPASQGSHADCDAVVDWVFAQYGRLDAIYPFGAVKESGDLTTMSDDAASASTRVLVQGVEWLIAAAARAQVRNGGGAPATVVVLPGSPNHGQFGGDGAYGAAKAALESLTNRWRAEHAVWGKYIALIGTRIGWTRGTGLMQANDVIATALEKRTGCRTFSTAEMAFLLTAILHPATRASAARAPVWCNFAGGFEKIADMGALARELRAQLATASPVASRRGPVTATPSEFTAVTGDRRPATGDVFQKSNPNYFAYPSLPTDAELARLPDLSHLNPHDVHVIVGYGEISPLGSSRTRWALEAYGALSLEACLELAWLTGRIRFESTPSYVGWVDVASGEPVADHEMPARYEATLRDSIGVREIQKSEQGFDPRQMLIFSDVPLTHDLCFAVDSIEQAQSYVAQYGESAEIVRPVLGAENNEAPLMVRLRKGAMIKVPRAAALSRYVAGQLPAGWDPTRFGVPKDLVAQVDRNTLYNFVATAEAFLCMGATPQEVLAQFHPARIGNAQGGGMGGQESLAKLYHDYREDRPRKGDVLQETLINVMAGWITQSMIGAYGSCVHPVGACATAVVSLDVAVNLLAANKSDFVIAGGFDDCSAEGVLGFNDMEATADVNVMQRRGIDARGMSRPNDRRRGGFVEAQGGGTLLVTRLSCAAELGLPIYGVIGLTATHSDGVHTSIPAPGLGLLAMANRSPVVGRQSPVTATATSNEFTALTGDRRPATGPSPLAAALARFGLTADDISAVSKHDTSTSANDPNENRLHHLLQTALGRSAGLPLMVHSQKALLGHAKGGAGAWQAIAALQMLNSGIIPGNPNLEDLDPAMQIFDRLCFSNRPLIQSPRSVRAVMFTSLGFGHVGAGALFIHPDCALQILSPSQRADYVARRAIREAARIDREWCVRLGLTPAFERLTKKPFATSTDEERMLLGG